MLPAFYFEYKLRNESKINYIEFQRIFEQFLVFMAETEPNQ